MARRNYFREKRFKYTAIGGTVIIVAMLLVRMATFWAFRLPPDPVAADAVVGGLAGWLIRGEWENSIWAR